MSVLDGDGIISQFRDIIAAVMNSAEFEQSFRKITSRASRRGGTAEIKRPLCLRFVGSVGSKLPPTLIPTR